jgi:translation initiation factor 2 alpha subunit (eIF-2alpha)
MIDLKEGNLVLCVVERISGTTIFVKIDDIAKEGTIITSEIAPGRIRNIRDYVVPGKRIVCKILSIDRKGNIHLSLRRVTAKEKKEILEKYQRERNSLSILKSVVKDEIKEKVGKIKVEERSLHDFLQSCKIKPEKLEKYFTKQEAAQILKILREKKEKQVEVKRQFSLTSNQPDGIIRIKKILLPYKEQVSYLAAGKFVLRIKGENYKEVKKQIEKILQEIEEKAKQENCEFEVKEK